MLEDGDVATIHYVGRVKDTGEIFDLTADHMADEDVDLDEDEVELGPVDVLVGAGHVIPGLEDALRDLAEGEEATVTVDPEDAFGQRRSDAVETVSRSQFDEHDVTPRRGLVVEIDGRRGKILSASSGRVRVDFNHPLAGKELEYDVEVLEVLDDVADRVEAVLDRYGEDEYAVDDGAVTVTLDEQNAALADRLEEELSAVKGVDAVEVRTA